MATVSLSPIERARKKPQDRATPVAEGCADFRRAFLGAAASASDAEIRRTWNTWQSMVDRCLIPGHVNAHRYGDRGIAVCERWFLFSNFVADMGVRPEGLTLDRVDRDGAYTPDNCKWSTPTEQARNTSRNVMVGGVTQREAARALGIHESTLSRRLARSRHSSAGAQA